MGEKICRKFIKTKLSEWLNENESLLNKILDKISYHGITSLSKDEIEYLNQYSLGNIDKKLEKSLSVDSGYIFTSKNRNVPIISFEYMETEDYGDEIIHKGTISFLDNEFEGSIFCDGEGVFERGEFYIYEDDGHGNLEQIGDLYDIGEGLEHEIDQFFSDEVCPYLTYS